MQSKINPIYVRFIDGTSVKIPVRGALISENIYQLLPNPEFDFIDDASVFEFGSLDVVKVKKCIDFGKFILLANDLVKQGDERNSFKRLLFSILNDKLTFQDILRKFSKADIVKLISLKNRTDSVYPAIREFIDLNHSQILDLAK